MSDITEDEVEAAFQAWWKSPEGERVRPPKAMFRAGYIAALDAIRATQSNSQPAGTTVAELSASRSTAKPEGRLGDESPSPNQWTDEQVEAAAAIIWTELWKANGLGQVTPDMFRIHNAGPLVLSVYMIAARAALTAASSVGMG